MSEQTQTAQGGFVQGITLPVVRGCCGTAGACPTTGCCGEPVMASAPPSGIQAAVGCCGEPVAPQEKSAVPSQSCCG
jgi:hypothetical protein